MLFRLINKISDKAVCSVSTVFCVLAVCVSVDASAVVTEDYDFPYVTQFESVTSVHDDAADTDPANDINGQADWTLEGDWGINGTHNAWSSYGGIYHLDNNPSEVDQYNHHTDHHSTMNGFVEIPADSVNPVLSYYYKLNLLHQNDHQYVEIQVEGSVTWDLIKDYREELNQSDYAQAVFSLATYKGQSVRIRFRQHSTNFSGARLFVIDDLYIGEEVIDSYDYPYINDLESVTSVHDDATDTDPNNDINGRADWNLQGDWAVSTAGSHSGVAHMNGNPSQEDQHNHKNGHLATMKGKVKIPSASVFPVLNFHYKLELLHLNDRLYVEIQAEGSATWTLLKDYIKEHNHADYAQETVSLDAYKGQAVRIRFRQHNTNFNGVRKFSIDDIRIADLSIEDYDYPYENNFDSATSVHDDATDSDASNDVNGQADWNVQGDWGINGAHNAWTSHSGVTHLDNNPQEEDQLNHNDGQQATMRGGVDIPVNSLNPVINFSYKLNLISQYDRQFIDIQIVGTDTWNLLSYYSDEHNHNEYTQERISLSAYKGQSIRIRFRQHNSNVSGLRMFVVDDFRIGDEIVDDYDYPYENDFESATSVHDDATDSNSANDLNGRADWNLQGDWGMSGVHNSWSNYSGTTHLDNNPIEEEQDGHNEGQLATLNGVVEIPVDSINPVLTYHYKLALTHINDAQDVEIQVAGTESWEILRSYTDEHNQSEYAMETLSLEAYKGQSVRIRFRQHNVWVSGVRMFVVDDFRIGDLQVEDFDYPYVNDFDSATSTHDDISDENPANDINGRDDWNIQGDWGIAGAHTDWTTYSGSHHLDNNPQEENLGGHSDGQLAAMKGLVSIPADSQFPVLGFYYKLNLVTQYDRLFIDIQTQGSNQWDLLSYYSSEHNHNSYTREEISLSAYKGQSVRIRFRQHSDWSSGVGMFVVDDFSIDERTLDDYDYPYVNDFESLTSTHDDASDSSAHNDVNGQADWNLLGDWGVGGAHTNWTPYNGEFHLDNNPQEEEQGGHNDGQLAVMNGLLEIPADSDMPVVSYRYKLVLPNNYDYQYVEVQVAGTDTWQLLKAYSDEDNQVNYSFDSISLSAYKGQSIRIRFRQHNDWRTGARLFVVDDFRITEQAQDTDNDGYPDTHDLFPTDPTEHADLDGDGIGDNSDLDKDGDGMPDGWELQHGFDPLDATDGTADADSDGINNADEYLQGSDPWFPAGARAVTWTDLVNTTATGNTLTRAVGSGWSAGAASVDIIPGDGAAEFTVVAANTLLVLGLSNENVDTARTTVGYGIYTDPGGNLAVIENGNVHDLTQVLYQVGDILKVERTGTTVVYKQNGTVFYTSTVPSSGNLIVDASIYSYEAQIANAFIFGAMDDNDGDIVDDNWETANGLNPNDGSDATLDNDGDGLSNLGEYQNHTDPNNSDSDGDGMPDGWELQHGFDPLDATDGTAD
ncbi:hypothetical protein ACFL2V_11400, partial [Pseudomonadota bacterium]